MKKAFRKIASKNLVRLLVPAMTLVLLSCAAAVAAEIVETPRTDAPIGNYTSVFDRKQIVIKNGVDKRFLTYYLLAPQQQPATGSKLPLVVVLHDVPGRAHAAEYLASRQMRAEFPVYILVPQSPAGKEWAMPEAFEDNHGYVYRPEKESLPDVIAIIRDVLDKYPADDRRVYIIGCGDGGAGVYGAVARYPDAFAGGVVINSMWSIADASSLSGVPMIIEQGALDEFASPQIVQVMARQIEQQGGTVTYMEFPGIGHDCSNPNFYENEVWDWLFKQRKAE